MKNFKIFWLFAKYSVKTTLQSPLGILLFSVGKLIRFSMFFSFVYYLVSRTNLLAGYTLNQTIIFYLTYNIIDSLAQLLFREVYRFRPLVVSGELDSILLKPYHPFMRILIGGVDILDVGISIIYIGITGYFIAQLPGITLYSVVLYIALVTNALIIATGFHIAILALGILSTEVDHTIMIYRDFTKMGSFPIDIYKQPIQFIFTFVIPIGIMLTIPVKGLLGVLTTQLYLISFIMAAAILGSSLLFWQYALRRYQSWGG